MKLCWDNLEGARLSKVGTLIIKGHTFYEYESCAVCKEPYLGRRGAECCSPRCANTGERSALYQKLGSNNPNWTGGYRSKKIPRYDLYAPQLEPYEECRRQTEDPNILEVKCVHCRIWFTPKISEVTNRIGRMETGMGYFYCSDSCKEVCPLYKKTAKCLMKHDAIKAGRITLKNLRNEVPGWIRDKVLELDDHTCQMCGSKHKLHVHHEIPQKRNQMLAADIENCVSMCIPCHVWVHTQIDGCRYHELADLEIC